MQQGWEVPSRCSGDSLYYILQRVSIELTPNTSILRLHSLQLLFYLYFLLAYSYRPIHTDIDIRRESVPVSLQWLMLSTRIHQNIQLSTCLRAHRGCWQPLWSSSLHRLQEQQPNGSVYSPGSSCSISSVNISNVLHVVLKSFRLQENQ